MATKPKKERGKHMATTKKSMVVKEAKKRDVEIQELIQVTQDQAAQLLNGELELDRMKKLLDNCISPFINWFKHFKKRKTTQIIILQPSPEDFGTIVGACSAAKAAGSFIIVDAPQELVAKKQIALIMKEYALPLPVSFE